MTTGSMALRAPFLRAPYTQLTMTRRFQADLQGLSYAELWRFTRSWQFLAAAFTKLIHGFRPSGAVFVHAVPFEDFELPASEIDPDVLEACEPTLVSLRAQGFAVPLWQRSVSEGGEIVTSVATLRHERLPAIARIFHSRNVAMGLPGAVSASIMSGSERSGGIVTTSAPHRFASLPTVRTYHLAGASPERLLAQHESAIAGVSGLLAVPDDDVLRRLTDMAEEQSHAWGIARGRYVELPDGAPSAETAADPFEAALFSELARAQRPRTDWSAVLAVALVSLALFVGLGGLHWNWGLAVIVAGVVLIHEAGHWVAMRAFGYQNMRMFFLPLLGAAVSGENWNVPAWKKAVVALAGPLPGIAGALALMAFGDAWSHPVLFKVIIVSLLVNGINLLPLMPLDGGTVVQSILFSRHPALETGFRIIAVIVGISAAVLGYGWVWALLAVLMLLGIKQALHEARATARLRAEGMVPAAANARGIPRESAVQILSALDPPTQAPRNPHILAPRILSVYGRLNSPPPRLIVGFLLLLLHAGGIAAAVAGASWLRSGRTFDAEEALRRDTSPVTSWATWSEGMPAEPSRTHLLILEVADVAEAVALADSLHLELEPGERLTRFGQTILLGTPCARVEHWTRDLADAVNVAPPSSSSAACKLTCKADDRHVAAAVADELMLGRASPVELPPPWSHVPPGGENAAARIRQTFRLHDQARREAMIDPDMRTETLARVRIMKRLVVEAQPEAVDLVVAQLLLAHDELQVAEPALGHEERERRSQECVRELAMAMGVKESADESAFLLAYAMGDQVQLSIMGFDRLDAELPLIAGWMSANGCKPARYHVIVHEADADEPHRCTVPAN